jgi:hypothetical protein
MFPNCGLKGVDQLVIVCIVKALLATLLVRTLQSCVYRVWDCKGTLGGYSGRSRKNQPRVMRVQSLPVVDSARYKIKV